MGARRSLPAATKSDAAVTLRSARLGFSLVTAGYGRKLSLSTAMSSQPGLPLIRLAR
ncbi:hypothetical protein K443DRAFT_675406 [Laccaria amethystina LaAM-08-1]|uniref:Uncharacterized protein n=1 Tax=Laccaria amethystina LaAM-08-1 TaxID=1095629 RepID=A0A0C9WZ98_9AGAR|nr:hypothetical protein K443DRAFT_675406 [Laccaria amethystina LaAM-08-1]